MARRMTRHDSISPESPGCDTIGSLRLRRRATVGQGLRTTVPACQFSQAEAFNQFRVLCQVRLLAQDGRPERLPFGLLQAMPDGGPAGLLGAPPLLLLLLA